MLELQNAWQQLAGAEIAGLLAVVILLLIWLIRGIVRKAGKAPAIQSAEGARRKPGEGSSPAPAPKVAVNSIAENAVKVQPPAAAQAAGAAVVTSAAPIVEARKIQQPAYCGKCVMPQDSVLKRHFIAKLQAEIESGLSPRPSDSVLRRHYQALVATELEKRLSALKG